MGDKHTALPDGQSPTVVFTVLAQLCYVAQPKANEAEVGATLFTKNGKGKNFDLDFDTLPAINL